MRTKEDIQKEYINFPNSDGVLKRLMFELLLDIRELLDDNEPKLIKPYKKK